MKSTGPLERFRLDDRVVLITGASSGLGAGFARALVQVGAKVVLVARREDKLRELASELEAEGHEILTCRGDVSALEDCEAAAAAAVARFGRIDVLVNNAGVGQAGSALREDPEVFRSTVDINLNGVYWMCRACAPHMPSGSSIVNIASVLGLVASTWPQAAYNASKAGVIGLTKDLAGQWTARRGIRVNALCPGYFESEITQNSKAGDELRDMVGQRSIMGRFGSQEELDSALLFLASDASSYMTGASLLIDGGISATI